MTSCHNVFIELFWQRCRHSTKNRLWALTMKSVIKLAKVSHQNKQKLLPTKEQEEDSKKSLTSSHERAGNSQKGKLKLNILIIWFQLLHFGNARTLPEDLNNVFVPSSKWFLYSDFQESTPFFPAAWLLCRKCLFNVLLFFFLLRSLVILSGKRWRSLWNEKAMRE